MAPAGRMAVMLSLEHSHVVGCWMFRSLPGPHRQHRRQSLYLHIGSCCLWAVLTGGALTVTLSSGWFRRASKKPRASGTPRSTAIIRTRDLWRTNKKPQSLETKLIRRRVHSFSSQQRHVPCSNAYYLFHSRGSCPYVEHHHTTFAEPIEERPITEKRRASHSFTCSPSQSHQKLDTTCAANSASADSAPDQASIMRKALVSTVGTASSSTRAWSPSFPPWMTSWQLERRTRWS